MNSEAILRLGFVTSRRLPDKAICEANNRSNLYYPDGAQNLKCDDVDSLYPLLTAVENCFAKLAQVFVYNGFMIR